MISNECNIHTHEMSVRSGHNFTLHLDFLAKRMHTNNIRRVINGVKKLLSAFVQYDMSLMFFIYSRRAIDFNLYLAQLCMRERKRERVVSRDVTQL